MRKIFISQPQELQDDLTTERKRNFSLKVAECVCHEELELLDCCYWKAVESGKGDISEVIKLMLEADVVCFAEGWEKSDECELEYTIAEKCKKPIIKISYNDGREEVTLRNIREVNE